MSQTADRAFDLLELVVRSEQPLALMELSAATGLDKTTTARLLRFLLERSMLVRDSMTKKYSVGPGLFSLAAAVTRRSNLHQIVIPHLVDLRDRTDETATLHVRVGFERICIAGVESRQLVRRVAPLGEPIPLWEGASGKVILAFTLSDGVEEVLSRASACGADIKRIRRQLAQIRELGYVLAANGERAPDVGAVSAPIFGFEGIKASLTVAGPRERWTRERMEDAVPVLKAAAAQISDGLGGQMDEPLPPSLAWATNRLG